NNPHLEPIDAQWGAESWKRGTIGKRVKGQEIFFMGPSAGPGVVRPVETRMFFPVALAMPMMGHRSLAMGRILGHIDTSQPVRKYHYTMPAEPVMKASADASVKPAVIATLPPGTPEAVLDTSATVRFKGLLAATLDRFRFEKGV